MSTEDRRAWDPYAAPPIAAPEPEPQPELAESPDALPADLDALRKPELIALAEQHGLDSSGTKAEIIARLLDAQG